MGTTSSLSDALFSRTQQRVYGLLFGQPERSFYLKEIIELSNVGRGTVQRELARMSDAGLVTVSRVGNQKHFQANPECVLFPQMIKIIRHLDVPRIKVRTTPTIKNTIRAGPGITLSRAGLKKLANAYRIQRLVLFGSAARGELSTDSDIDLLVEFKSGKAPSLGGMTDLKDALSVLFGGRKMDLATSSILDNPYRRRAIEKDMEVLYAA